MCYEACLDVLWLDYGAAEITLYRNAGTVYRQVRGGTSHFIEQAVI